MSSSIIYPRGSFQRPSDLALHHHGAFACVVIGAFPADIGNLYEGNGV